MTPTEDAQTKLEEALIPLLGDFDLELSQQTIKGLGRHYALMIKWNKTHNLTRITDPTAAARDHYLDCLLGLRHLESSRDLMDVGSGAGFPGLVAGLMWPERRIRLIEPVRKKASFLQTAIVELGLKCVQVENKRVQEVEREEMVMTRATFSWALLQPAFEAVRPGGQIVLFTGSSLLEPPFPEIAADAGFFGAEEHRYGQPLFEHHICSATLKK
jgi:16S rRNA (guanine527-N7)-methyltransferase